MRTGLYLTNRPPKLDKVNKWNMLSMSFKIFLDQLIFLFFISLLLVSVIQKNVCHHSGKIQNSVLFATNIYYYYRSCEFLFICHDVEQHPGHSEGLFRFCSWNLNSLVTANFSRVSSIQAYSVLNDLHLIALTESATTPDTLDEQIDIPGFTIIRNDLTNGDSHGGVLIYHKSNLAAKHRLDLQNYKNTLVVELHISRKKVFFVLVYRKFGQSPEEFEIFLEKMDEVFQKINSEEPYCIVTCGDYNARHSGWWNGDKTNRFGTSIQKLFADHLLIQIVNQPTHITQTSRSCIDLVATDQPNLILSNEIHPSLHTNCHHQINFIKMNLKLPPHPSINVEFGIMVDQKVNPSVYL